MVLNIKLNIDKKLFYKILSSLFLFVDKKEKIVINYKQKVKKKVRLKLIYFDHQIKILKK